jgi:hypothetical protein
MKFIVLAVLVCLVSAKSLDNKPIFEPLSKELIDYVNKVSGTWTAGESKFDNWSLLSIKRLMGVKKGIIRSLKI